MEGRYRRSCQGRKGLGTPLKGFWRADQRAYLGLRGIVYRVWRGYPMSFCREFHQIAFGSGLWPGRKMILFR